jgi:hypothetical protein
MDGSDKGDPVNHPMGETRRPEDDLIDNSIAVAQNIEGGCEDKGVFTDDSVDDIKRRDEAMDNPVDNSINDIKSM